MDQTRDAFWARNNVESSELTRVLELVINEPAPAPAPSVIFKVGSGSSHFKEEKLFGRNVDNLFTKIIVFKNISVY